MERQPIRRSLFLTHGEDEEIDALAERLVARGLPREKLVVPELDDLIELDGERARPEIRPAKRRLPPDAGVKRDWHNELAQFSFDLRDALEQAADEKSRAKILRRLKRALSDHK